MSQKDASTRLRKAVKENNIFLVKRLIQRTDFRNPDPSTRRFTSLAWAAVLGYEELFEFLLAAGHDDEELSKDWENNTILSLLAETRPTNVGPATYHPDIIGTALRMAHLYHERYPFILEWSNFQGKTALHVAALKGNDELLRMFCDRGADFDLPDNLGNTPLHYASAWGHVPIVQFLIESGCQFAARNNQGFTASDFAYSFNTMNTLQETARMQFEANKKARRQVFQQAAAKGFELVGMGSSVLHMHEPLLSITTTADTMRLLNISKDSTISGSDDDDDDFRPENSMSMPSLHRRSPFSTSSQTSTNTISTGSSLRYYNPPHDHLAPVVVGANLATPSVLSPIVTRMRERDADAMAEYKKRHRSGSAGTSMDKSQINSYTHIDLPSNGGNSVSYSRSNWIGIPQLAGRRLRSSASAAQLRGNQIAGVVSTDQQGPRCRSGTDPTTIIGENQVSSENVMSGRASDTKIVNRRLGISPRRTGDVEDYTGPSSEYAIFPPPPESRNLPSVLSSKSNIPSTRRAAFALLSKPLSNTDGHWHGNSSGQRSHRRGISTSELRG